MMGSGRLLGRMHNGGLVVPAGILGGRNDERGAMVYGGSKNLHAHCGRPQIDRSPSPPTTIQKAEPFLVLPFLLMVLRDTSEVAGEKLSYRLVLCFFPRQRSSVREAGVPGMSRATSRIICSSQSIHFCSSASNCSSRSCSAFSCSEWP